MVVPSAVLPPKSLARYLERHRLLDETSGIPPERFLGALVRRALDFVPAASAFLVLDDPVAKEEDRSRNDLTVVVVAGAAPSTLLGRKVRPVDGIVGFVYARGERTSVNEVGSARALSNDLDALLSSAPGSVLGVPVVIEAHVCGALVLVDGGGGGFGTRDERLMELFGDTLSLALQNLLDERRAREVARRDSLTALYNDRYFHKKLQQEVDRLAAGRGEDLALLFLDCDHLKAVNDEHGHLAGSQVLREMSYVLQRALSGCVSLPCRYGGDEFTVVLLDTDLAAAVEVAERIRKAVEDWTFLPMSIGPGEPALAVKGLITISIGVATWKAHCDRSRPAAEQKNELLKRADAALYQAKMAGKNCVIASDAATQPTGGPAVILKS